MPNGSSLDYVVQRDLPRAGGHRVGVQKQSWNGNLYLGGQLGGFYAPIGTDTQADITGWKAITDSGGPFDANTDAQRMTDELTRNHSALYIDDSVQPAPALLANGWNDDLFPVDESLRYYNKVRARWPNAPITMFHLDFGHSPRAGSVSTADATALNNAINAWMDYYVKGVGPEPTDARGGVDILTSKCPVSGAGTRYHAPSWPQLAPGEIRLDTTGTQTIPRPAPRRRTRSRSGDVCTTTGSADNASAATYKVPAATSAYTLAGSPTIVAKLTTTGANDMVAARLYDVDGATQRLIARGVQRPLGVGAGPTQQVFQLHPQAWTVQPGHVLKLELLAQDSPYLRTSSRPRRSSGPVYRPAAAAPRPSTRRGIRPWATDVAVSVPLAPKICCQPGCLDRLSQPRCLFCPAAPSSAAFFRERAPVPATALAEPFIGPAHVRRLSSPAVPHGLHRGPRPPNVISTVPGDATLYRGPPTPARTPATWSSALRHAAALQDRRTPARSEAFSAPLSRLLTYWRRRETPRSPSTSRRPSARMTPAYGSYAKTLTFTSCRRTSP
jgi:hypothetical protein